MCNKNMSSSCIHCDRINVRMAWKCKNCNSPLCKRCEYIFNKKYENNEVFNEARICEKCDKCDRFICCYTSYCPKCYMILCKEHFCKCFEY